MCSLLGSLKGLKGTEDMTTAPHLVCSALSYVQEPVQESGKGNTAGSVDIAETPSVVPEKSDRGIKKKLVASHLFVICQALPPTQQLVSYSQAALS